MSPAAKSQILRITLLFGRLLLGGVFLYAAYTKLRHPWPIFAMSINSYQILPEWGVVFIARVLPWLELALGALLVLGVLLRYVAAASSALLVFFLAVMVRSYFLGLGIDCGCFGVGEALSPSTLIRDGVLTALSVALTVLAFIAARKPRTAELPAVQA